jgi:hypothetical protein
LAPVGGIFARLSSIVGLHHFSYYFEQTFEPLRFTKEVKDYHTNVKMWT